MTDKKSTLQLWFIPFSFSSYGSLAWVGQSGLVHLFGMVDVPVGRRDFFLSSSPSSSMFLLLFLKECEQMSKYKTWVPQQKMRSTPHGSNPVPANSSQSVSPYNSSGLVWFRNLEFNQYIVFQHPFAEIYTEHLKIAWTDRGTYKRFLVVSYI